LICRPMITTRSQLAEPIGGVVYVWGMRMLSLLACGLLSYTAPAQALLGGQLPLVEGKVTYSAVVPRDSVSARDLYEVTRRWVVAQYASVKDVTQLEDPEKFEVIVRGWFPVTWPLSFGIALETEVWHRVTVACKEGRFRYEFSDFTLKWSAGAPPRPYSSPLETWNANKREKAMQDVHRQIDQTVNDMLKRLMAAVDGKAEKDDW
jgi:hypothetical protein